MRISNIRYPLLPVSRAWLSVALAVRGAVAGVWVSSSWWRGDGAAWRRGVSRAGLVPCAGLRAGRQAVVSRLGGLGGIVLGREGSWWILLGCLRWMRLLLATLEAWSLSGSRGLSLGGGRSVVLKLLLLLLLGGRLRGSGLSAVSRVLHTVLLLLRWGTWLLRRVSTWSLVLLVHLTIHASWGALLYSRIGSLWLGGHSWLRGCR